MTTMKVIRVAGGFQLIIPEEIAAEASLTDGMELIASATPGRIVLEVPGLKKPKQYTLEELVAGITPENMHGEIDWGPPVGKEVW